MSRFLLSAVVVLTLLASPGLLSAQTPLGPIQFINSWSWIFDSTFESNVDSTASREPFSGSAGAGGYSLNWDVTYGSSGSPPEVTAACEVTYGGGGASFLSGSASSDIVFEIRVVQTATPPNQITTVPVRFQAQGTVDISGGDETLYGEAQAYFQVGPTFAPLIQEFIFATFNGVPSAAFNVDDVQALDLGEVIVCRMGAVAIASADAPAASGTENATAYVDPVIEVLDTPIPTTNQSYQDYFVVQFSLGYSDATPTRKTTWGSIKRMYGGKTSP